MTRTKQERYFAGIPLRVWLDRRLTRRHIVVLGIIAAQFGANGQGCTAKQRRLAELAGYSETHFSEAVRDLRDWGYITSEFRERGRQRVHRIVWNNEVDKCFWQSVGKENPTSRPREVKAAQLPTSGKSTSHQREVQLPVLGDKIGPSDSDDNDLGRVTYVLTESKQIKEDLNGNQDQTDCAEARNRRRGFSVVEAESYLAQCDAIAAEGDPDQQLKFERVAIEQVADDACLPEALTDRARSLLAGNGAWMSEAFAARFNSPPEFVT
jgi:hypothetical protein